MLRHMNISRSSFSRATMALTTLFISACLEPYTPAVSAAQIDLVVVDGFLDSSDGSATVRLTKATNLDNAEPAPRIQNASVTIDGDDGSSFDLAEDTAGVYTIAAVPVNPSVKYRLHIQANASEYASDFVAIKSTPPIDSLTRGFSERGTTVYTNAHDDSGTTRYYRWEYTETYEYTSRLYSQYKIVNKEPIYRKDTEQIYRCYKTLTSSKIYVASTLQLDNDVVRSFPLINIPPSNRKLYIRYSALVKQRAISKEEYTFLDQLRKTTEGIGTLFDPQPSQVLGNIHNLNGGVSPLGYFSAGNTTSKRIFIRYNDLPDYLKHQDLAYCPVDTICVVPDVFICSKNIDEISGHEYLIDGLSSSETIIAYTQTSAGCADCRLGGGTVTKPAFWP